MKEYPNLFIEVVARILDMFGISLPRYRVVDTKLSKNSIDAQLIWFNCYWNCSFGIILSKLTQFFFQANKQIPRIHWEFYDNIDNVICYASLLLQLVWIKHVFKQVVVIFQVLIKRCGSLPRTVCPYQNLVFTSNIWLLSIDVSFEIRTNHGLF